MTSVAFEVEIPFEFEARAVWDLLTDWQAHEDFVPATRVTIHEEGSDDGIGMVFTAFSGYGPLTLVDKMQVTTLGWDDTTNSGYCEVDKLGPVLDGMAGLRVQPTDTGSTVTWTEDLTIEKLPRVLAPIAAKLGALGFRVALSVLFSRELKKRQA